MASPYAALKSPAIRRRENVPRTAPTGPPAGKRSSGVDAITYTPAPWKKLKRFVQRGLTTKERLLITLHYCERLTMAEIGVVLEMPESRVVELHRNVVERVRKWVLADFKHRPQVA